jgi:predicted short-subunit dehydrogenase-like oxidoreductase (DUF2520 family)
MIAIVAMRLGIIGGGRAAWAFGSSWGEAGWPLAGVALRPESASRIDELLLTPRRSVEALASDSDLILVAVSDDALAGVAARIPATGAIIFHASGFAPAVRGGFSLHPLRALPAVGEPGSLRDTLLVFEGAHEEQARRIAARLGARLATVSPEQKALYHAAAVFASNDVAALLDIAARLMAATGIGDVRDDLVRLAYSAIDNWRSHDDARRFTGPAARGDRAVIARHLEALAGDPDAARIYALLADRIAGPELAGGE